MVGPMEERPGLYLAIGFSGHGFQISPAVGEAVASELRTGTRSDALRELRPRSLTDAKAPTA